MGATSNSARKTSHPCSIGTAARIACGGYPLDVASSRNDEMGRIIMMACHRLQLSLLLAAALQLRVADTFLAPTVLLSRPVGCTTARSPRPSGRGALGVCMQDKLDELLQKLGAESFERNAGLTPLDLAIYSLQTRQTTARLEALLSKGAAMARHPWNNQTALDAAAFQGRQDVVDMLLAHGAIPDARLHLQWGDGVGERKGADYLQAQAAAYQAAIREAASQSDTQTHVAALERLGVVQTRLGAMLTPVESGVEAFREASRLRGDAQANVTSRCCLAMAGEDHKEHKVRKLEDLCVQLDEPGALQRAVALWRREGVVVFPALLSAELVDLLREHVVEVCEGSATGVDRSANIRKPLQRTLRAVGVRERREALQACILLLI